MGVYIFENRMVLKSLKKETTTTQQWGSLWALPHSWLITTCSTATKSRSGPREAHILHQNVEKGIKKWHPEVPQELCEFIPDLAWEQEYLHE